MGVGICDADKQKQLDVAKAAHDLRKKLVATRALAVDRADSGTARLHKGKAFASACHNAALSSKQAGLGSTPRRGQALSRVNVNRVNMKQQKELERGAIGQGPFTGNNHAR